MLTSFSIGGGSGLRSLVDHYSAGDYASNDRGKEQQPAPVLAGIPHGANEVSSIMLGKNGDEGVACSSTESDHDEELLHRVLGSTCGCEQEAGGVGKGTAVEMARAPVPHLSNSLKRRGTRQLPKCLFRYSRPAWRASLKVMNAPINEPAVAAAAYSYHGSW
jgi:hypothetical protein